MIEDITIIQTDDLQKRLGNQFLKQHKQPPAGQDDQLFIIKNSEKIIIGAARLETIDNHYWLRNAYIEESYRHQQLGTLLIKSMQYVMNQKTTFCFAIESLQNFYHQTGFIRISHEELPPQLQTKYLGYLQKTPTLKAYRFESNYK